MSVLVLPSAVTCQPQSPAAWDFQHPALVGMNPEVLFLPANGLFSAVGIKTPTVVGAYDRLAANLGKAGSGVGFGYNQPGTTSDVAGYFQFANRTAASANGGTFAAVFVKTATIHSSFNNFAYFFFFGNSVNVGPAASTTYNVGTQFSFFHDSTQLGSAVNITLNVPYFVICSWEAKGASSAWYIKIRNLNTGALDSDQSGTRTYSGTGSSTWSFAGNSAFGRAFPGYFYMAAMGSRYLDPKRADEWLRNPWQVLAPRQRRIWMPDVGGAPAGLAAHPMRGGGAAANPIWGYAA